MTTTADSHVETTSPKLTWQLVHAQPGALVYALPGIAAPQHPLVRRAAGHVGGWLPGGPAPAKHANGDPMASALHHAEFIGRVGLLAAALGIGAAVAGVAGIAQAEPADTGADTTTSSTTSSTSAEAEADSPSQTPETSESSSAITSEASGSADTTQTATETPPPSEASASQTTTTLTTPDSDSPPVVVSSSGGAHTTADTPEPTTITEATATAEPQAAPALEAPPRVTPPIEPVAAESGSRHATTPVRTPADTTPTVSPTEGQSPALLQTPTSPIAQPTAGAQVVVGQPSTTGEIGALPTTAGEAVPAVPAPAGPLGRLVSTVLAPFKPTATAPAARAAQTPLLWGFLAWARRGFTNSIPTKSYEPTGTEQVDDTLTYTVAGGPAEGTVTITSDGAFTYTPAAVGATTTSADVPDGFTVTVSDANGASATVPVRVAIDPDTAQGARTLTFSDPEGAALSVNASLAVTDPDTDPVTYLVVHDPSYGAMAEPITEQENTVVATTDVERHPTEVALSPDGSRAYVTNGSSRSVSVIDTATNTVVATVGWAGSRLRWRSAPTAAARM